MSLFKRIKNIVKSNINFGSSSFQDYFNVNTNFDDYESFTDTTENFSKKDFENQNTNPKAHNIEAEYYANLELSCGASFEEIKKQYRKLLKKYHPDKFHNDPQKYEIAQKIVKKLNKAYNYFEEKYNK